MRDTPRMAAELDLSHAPPLLTQRNTMDAGASGAGSVEGIEQELSVAYERNA